MKDDMTEVIDDNDIDNGHNDNDDDNDSCD